MRSRGTYWGEIMKINIGDKDGKTYKVELDAGKSAALAGKKIGEELEGDLIGVPGYIFEIKGGSDNSGFPMRKDVRGAGKKVVFIGGGPGIRKAKKGLRRRKTVRGNTISEEISQVNVIVKKAGAQPLSEMFKKEEEEKKEEK